MKSADAWLRWFIAEYGDGIATNSNADMIYAQNKILCGIADALEAIAIKMEESK